MRFDQQLAARMQAAKPREFLEYPKWIKVDGADVLVQSAEEEAEALGAPSENEGPSSEEDAAASVENLLSAPDKRKPGRPVGWRKPVLVPNESKD
jgi:hypothetical protein